MLRNRPYTPFARTFTPIRRVRVKTPPAEYPITLDEVKKWLGITDGASDGILNGLIQAATKSLEEYTRRVFIEQTLVITFDAWGSDTVAQEGHSVGSSRSFVYAVDILKPPLIAIFEVRYFLDDGTSNVYASSNYFTDNNDPNQYGRLVLNQSAQMPSYARPVVSWEIEYTAGYGDALVVPYAIKQAMLMLIAYLFTKRGDCADGDGINSRGAVLNPIEASGAGGILESYRILRL